MTVVLSLLKVPYVHRINFWIWPTLIIWQQGVSRKSYMSISSEKERPAFAGSQDCLCVHKLVSYFVPFPLLPLVCHTQNDEQTLGHIIILKKVTQSV
jgi:hypothetical protein